MTKGTVQKKMNGLQKGDVGEKMVTDLAQVEKDGRSAVLGTESCQTMVIVDL